MGVAVDGSTSYIPGDENPLDDIPSDEEEDSEEKIMTSRPPPTALEARGPATAPKAYAVLQAAPTRR